MGLGGFGRGGLARGEERQEVRFGDLTTGAHAPSVPWWELSLRIQKGEWTLGS